MNSVRQVCFAVIAGAFLFGCQTTSQTNGVSRNMVESPAQHRLLYQKYPQNSLTQMTKEEMIAYFSDKTLIARGQSFFYAADGSMRTTIGHQYKNGKWWVGADGEMCKQFNDWVPPISKSEDYTSDKYSCGLKVYKAGEYVVFTDGRGNSAYYPE